MTQTEQAQTEQILNEQSRSTMEYYRFVRNHQRILRAHRERGSILPDSFHASGYMYLFDQAYFDKAFVERVYIETESLRDSDALSVYHDLLSQCHGARVDRLSVCKFIFLGTLFPELDFTKRMLAMMTKILGVRTSRLLEEDPYNLFERLKDVEQMKNVHITDLIMMIYNVGRVITKIMPHNKEFALRYYRIVRYMWPKEWVEKFIEESVNTEDDDDADDDDDDDDNTESTTDNQDEEQDEEQHDEQEYEQEDEQEDEQDDTPDDEDDEDDEEQDDEDVGETGYDDVLRYDNTSSAEIRNILDQMDHENEMNYQRELLNE
jgi:hypothetical protein